MKCRIMKITNQENIGRIIAVSDIHGHVHYLDGVLKMSGYTVNDTLVIVGDMIEKGPESLKTIRYIMKLREENANVYVIMGNVDCHRIRSFYNDSPADFLNRFQWTKNVWKEGFFLDILNELGLEIDDISEENIENVRDIIKLKFAEELDFLWNLPTVLSIGNYIFVHAGVPTDDLNELQNVDATQCMKIDAFLNSDISFEKNVVVGHWPVCLYREDINCVNPILDHQRHIIAIDGGCGIKYGAQLNALIIPKPESDIREVTYVAYDDYPVLIAPTPQNEKEKTVCIRYYDCEVEVLEDRGDVICLRHISSDRICIVPKYFVYYRNGKAYCSDFSDACLEIKEGDKLSVIADTSAGYIVKKDGVIGWYKK